MCKTPWATVVVLLPGIAWATSIESVPNPRDHGGWVTDEADVLDAGAEDRLDALADGLKRDVGVEVAVVTLHTVDGTPKEFATALFNHWGIGESAHDNGLLVLLVLGERRLEMEVGIGLEASLPDEWLGEMQASSMVPLFKAGDFGGGLEAGVLAVDSRLRSAPGEAPPSLAPQPPAAEAAPVPTHVHVPAPRPVHESSPVSRRTKRPWFPIDPLLLLMLAVVLTAGVGVFLAGGLGAILSLPLAVRARLQRKCPECGGQTALLDELADDAHLDAGQLAEEKVGSIDWRVHVCLDCQHVTTTSWDAWFSGRIRCAGCQRKTGKMRSTTIVNATEDHGGEVLKKWDCAHCAFTRSETVTTPRRVRSTSTSSGSSWNTRPRSSSFGSSWGSSSSRSSSSSSSSSNRSSGGGFGGGKSKGGGKGSSW